MEIPEDEAIPLIQKAWIMTSSKRGTTPSKTTPGCQGIKSRASIKTPRLPVWWATHWCPIKTITEDSTTERAYLANRKGMSLTKSERFKGKQEAQKTVVKCHVWEIHANLPRCPTKRHQAWNVRRCGGMDLTAVHVEQRNQELETQLKLLKQKKKQESAPVGGVTQHGSTDTRQRSFRNGVWFSRLEKGWFNWLLIMQLNIHRR